MAKIFRAPDGRLHVVNPSLDLDLEIDLRRRNRPRTRWRPQNPDELELAAWLIRQAAAPDAEVEEPPAGMLQRAVDAGLLVSLHDVPRPEPAFRCDLDEATYELLPSGSGALPEAASWQPNDRVWVQSGDEVPEDVRRLLRTDEDHPGSPPESGCLDEERPIYWVLDRARHFLFPVWASGEPAEVLERFLETGEVPDDRDTRRLLWLAGLLYDEDAVSQRASRMSAWRDRLGDAGYAALRSVVPPLYVAAMRRYFRALEAEGFFEADREQVVGKRLGVYCDVASRHVQRQLGHLARHLTDEPLQPSYSWMRRYLPGAVLERHLDRAQCRWNLSLCADQDPEVSRDDAWPIWLEVDGEDVAARLGIGDCVIYRGNEIPHWRDALAEERSVTMCFLHFVQEDFEGSRA